MTDALLFVLVVDAIALALVVDVAAAIGWIRRRTGCRTVTGTIEDGMTK
jgi:hypothetical protein